MRFMRFIYKEDIQLIIFLIFLSSYFILLPFLKDSCFSIFTLIKKIYQMLATNTLFSVINYFPQVFTNRILINIIMFF